jgi:hypothetical protein
MAFVSSDDAIPASFYGYPHCLWEEVECSSLQIKKWGNISTSFEPTADLLTASNWRFVASVRTDGKLMAKSTLCVSSEAKSHGI